MLTAIALDAVVLAVPSLLDSFHRARVAIYFQTMDERTVLGVDLGNDGVFISLFDLTEFNVGVALPIRLMSDHMPDVIGRQVITKRLLSRWPTCPWPPMCPWPIMPWFDPWDWPPFHRSTGDSKPGWKRNR